MISHIIISMLSRDVRFKKYRYSLVTQRSRPPHLTIAIA